MKKYIKKIVSESKSMNIEFSASPNVSILKILEEDHEQESYLITLLFQGLLNILEIC